MGERRVGQGKDKWERERGEQEKGKCEREGQKGGLGKTDELHMVKSKHVISQPWYF